MDRSKLMTAKDKAWIGWVQTRLCLALNSASLISFIRRFLVAA